MRVFSCEPPAKMAMPKVIMQEKLIAVAYILKPVLSGWNL